MATFSSLTARLRGAAIGAALLAGASPAFADIFEPGDEISVQASIYNMHYSRDDHYIKYSPLVGVEWRRDNGWLVGAAAFQNSFGQFSQLAYGGYLWNLGNTNFYGKLTGGILHGYKGEYQNKVPLNYKGFSPGILPALGYKAGPFRGEVQFFWTSGFMVTVGYAFK